MKPGNHQVYDVLDTVPVRIHGWSMWPWLCPSDRVDVRSKAQPEIGDIVVVLRENEPPYIHRIVELNDQQFLSRGDNVRNDDGWRPREAIAGVVVRLYRLGLPVPLPHPLLVAILAPIFRFVFVCFVRPLRRFYRSYIK
jgi:phage repressor protein C with HTH and peptisase S24 domain